MTEDWLEAFIELTEGLPTPPLFRLWSGITTLSAVLERKVWLPTMRQILFPNIFTLLVGPPGSGKCFHPDEEMLTYDGQEIKVRDIQTGLHLLGPDGTPRRVTSIHRGYGQLYRVSPRKGKSWLCNGSHILTLKKSREPDAGRICHVSVEDWLTWTAWQKSEWKQWRSNQVTFSYREPPVIDPYFLGVWLGNGHHLDGGLCVSTDDKEIVEALQETCDKWGLRLSLYSNNRYGLVSDTWEGQWRQNLLLDEMRKYDVYKLCEEKHVPDDFKLGSIETRKLVLAGLLDTDGSLSRGGYDFISKSKNLAHDVVFIARSLGHAAYVNSCVKGCWYKGEYKRGMYWRVSISGELDSIPCRIARKKATARKQIKSVLNTGFTIEAAGEGEWIGFEVDGDKQLLMADFTVVHNSQSIKPARDLLRVAKCVNLAPTDMTKAAMVDVFAKTEKRILHNGVTTIYHPLCIILSEFGTLVSAHDLEFMSTINTAYDNEDIDSQRRGHNSGKAIVITNANLNILAGTQPGYLGALLPEAAWEMGFTSRLMMIYGDKAPSVDIFAEGGDSQELFITLARGLVERSKLLGPFRIMEEAKTMLRAWSAAGMPPVPEHSRLAHYRARRGAFLLKFCMIAAISRAPVLHITPKDVERAKSWLISAEKLMPDIFRDMMMKSDTVLMNELHRYAWQAWVKSSPTDISKRIPIAREDLMRFLALRCASNVAEKVLDIMLQAGWFEQDRTNPQLFIPRARGFRTDE